MLPWLVSIAFVIEPVVSSTSSYGGLGPIGFTSFGPFLLFSQALNT